MAGITARYFDRDFLGLLLMHILEMSAEDSTLGEPLGTVWTFVWFFTIVLSEVNLHVAALGECLSTVVNKTFEESLLPVGLWVVNLEYLALVVAAQQVWSRLTGHPRLCWQSLMSSMPQGLCPTP